MATAANRPIPKEVLIDQYERRHWVCPISGTVDGIANIAKYHFAYSNAGNSFWYIGEDLFPAWRDEHEDVWDKNFQSLDKMRKVVPVYSHSADSLRPGVVTHFW